MTDNIDRGLQAQDWASEAEDQPYKLLSREEAQALASRSATLSPWRVIAVQIAVGVGCAAFAWAVAQRSGVAWSVLYGAATVVVPGVLMARGMARQKSKTNPGAVLLGFMFWEIVKIAATVAMLAAAVKVVPDLSWLALLVTMIVCLKVSWFVLLRQSGLAVTKTHQRESDST